MIANKQELGGAVRPFHGEGGRFGGGKERHAGQHALKLRRALMAMMKLV
jgi:hypothetical protein